MSAEPAPDHTAPGVPIPDQAMFHGILGDIVEAVKPHTEADPVGIYVSLLAGCGAILGERPHIDIGSTRHPVLIWPLLFGNTGTGRKGEATNTAQLFLNEAFPHFKEQTVTGLSSGEGLIERIRDAEEIDGGKGQQPIVLGTEDKRLLCVEPEFSSVLARTKREGSTLAATLRQAWEGRDLSVLNRTQLRASSSHIAIVAHVTPAEFRGKLAAADMSGGTYNRFLPVYVERAKVLPLPTRLPFGRFGRLSSQLRTSCEAARDRDLIGLDPGAERLWSDVIYRDLTGDEDEEEMAWAEFTTRAPAYCLRVAGLLAVLSQDASELNRSDRYGFTSTHITTSHLTAAYALVRYSIDSAKFVLSTVHRDRSTDRLTRAIAASKDGLTRTEIRDLFGRHKTGEEVDVLVARLDLDPAYEVAYEHSGGRPREVVRLAGTATKADQSDQRVLTTAGGRDRSDRSDQRSANDRRRPNLALVDPHDPQWLAQLTDEHRRPDDEPEEDR